ncbi:MAG: hypothetical protein WBP18_19920 [Paracoccaceae bacterium]
MIDYARLFREHAAEVLPGEDDWGRPGEVLNLPDGTSLWRSGPADSPRYSGTSTVGTACGFMWALFAIDSILQCPEGVPPDQLATVNLTADRVLTYWGQNTYPPRSLAEMQTFMQRDQEEPGERDCAVIKTGPDRPIDIAQLISGEEFQAALKEELAKPPHLMVTGRCY